LAQIVYFIHYINRDTVRIEEREGQR